jgi:hypothetical protein
MFTRWDWRPYQFVAADYGHDAERLNTILLGIEGRARAIVSEDDIGMNLGIQVGDANLVAGDGVFETRLRLSIAAATASSVFTSAALLAVAVDVHVNELFPVAVQVNDAGGSIFAVPERFSADD